MLVYGCTSLIVLETILVMQRKILRLIYFKSKHESVSKVFEDIKILTVHELYVYELINLYANRSIIFQPLLFSKFFVSSITVKNVPEVLDCSLLQFHPSYQRSILFPFKHRGSKVLNFLSRKGLLPKIYGSMKNHEVTDFVHL